MARGDSDGGAPAGAASASSAPAQAVAEAGSRARGATDSLQGQGPARARDLVIVTDATGSMGLFLTSITESISQFASVMRLTDCFDRMRVLAYYDYCDLRSCPGEEYGGMPLRASPWGRTLDDLGEFVSQLTADGGGDMPEAAKSAAHMVLQWAAECPGRDVVVVWYADAPPHSFFTGGANCAAEQRVLGTQGFDWLWICGQLAAAGVQVCPIINTSNFHTAAYFTLLAERTGGAAVCVTRTSPRIITQVTINLVLGLMGCEYDLQDARRLEFDTPVPATVASEARPDGFLPGAGAERRIVCNPPTLHPDPKLYLDLSRVSQRFRTDPSYRETVFAEFQRLLTPTGVLALTYNSALGTLWRAICRQRDDGRREQLLAAVNVTLTQLCADEAQAVRAWLAASYDSSEQVRAVLQAAPGPRFPAVMADVAPAAGPRPSPQELLELSRSCHATVLRRVGQLLASLRVIEEPLESAVEAEAQALATAEDSVSCDDATDDAPLETLPLSLPDRDLFALLPHLLAPGTMFSRRPAAILAALALTTHCAPLAARAANFLATSRGTWIDHEQPENYSLGLARLMLQAHESLLAGGSMGALEPAEVALFTVVTRVGGLAATAHTPLDVVQAVRPCKVGRPDVKRPCARCGVLRSFTLLAPGDVCGLCASGDNGTQITEPLGEGRSYWCECRTCHGHYAVVRVEQLNTLPKCHFCRTGSAAPLRRCGACTNLFVDPCLTPADAQHAFVCPACVEDPASSLEHVQVPVKQVVMQNRHLLAGCLGLDVPAGLDVFARLSLFKLLAQGICMAQGPDCNGTLQTDPQPQLILCAKTILNSKDVHTALGACVAHGQVAHGACTLCFEDVPLRDLGKACGRRGCTARACTACLDTWYGAAQPGSVLTRAQLLCPFCKAAPAPQLLQRHNRQLRGLKGRWERGFMADAAWHYAWCISCYRAHPWMQRTCVAEVGQLPDAFLCEGCEAAAVVLEAATVDGVLVGTRQCPHCGHGVVKAGGCDHIACVCGEHWCWQCGTGGFGPEDIYDHLESAHRDYNGGEAVEVWN